MRATLPAHPRLLDVRRPEPEALHVAFRGAADDGRRRRDRAARGLGASEAMEDQRGLHARARARPGSSTSRPASPPRRTASGWRSRAAARPRRRRRSPSRPRRRPGRRPRTRRRRAAPPRSRAPSRAPTRPATRRASVRRPTRPDPVAAASSSGSSSSGRTSAVTSLLESCTNPCSFNSEIESGCVAGVTSTAAGTPTAALRSMISPMSAARRGAPIPTAIARLTYSPGPHSTSCPPATASVSVPQLRSMDESANANATAFCADTCSSRAISRTSSMPQVFALPISVAKATGASWRQPGSVAWGC